jgi:anti-anti-sigma factor
MPATLSASSSRAELLAREEADAVVVALRGEIGVDQVSDLFLGLTRVAALKPKRVIFDLTDLTYIASLGLGTIIQLRRSVLRAGGVVILRGPRPLVRELIVDLALADLFVIEE